jgi:hypothetical protein
MINLLIEAFNFSDPRARTFPVVFGIPTVIMLLVIITIHIAPSIINSDKIENGLVNDSFYDFTNEERGEINSIIMLVFLSFPFFAFLFGFFISVPLYTGLFTVVTTRSIKKSISVATFVSIGWYLLFVLGLNVVFYEGVLTDMVL